MTRPQLNESLPDLALQRSAKSGKLSGHLLWGKSCQDLLLCRIGVITFFRSIFPVKERKNVMTPYLHSRSFKQEVIPDIQYDPSEMTSSEIISFFLFLFSLL